MSPRNRRQKISSIPYSDIEQRENTSFEKPQIESMLKCGISKNAARERTRVKSLRNAFHTLQEALPSVPPNTKLSKLDVLVLATTYISHLRRILGQDLDDISQEVNSCPIMTENPSDPLSAYAFDLMDHRPKRKTNYLHPVRKWPMRSRLYAGIEDSMSSTALNMPSNYYQQWT